MRKIKKSRKDFRDFQDCRYITLKKNKINNYNLKIMYEKLHEICFEIIIFFFEKERTYKTFKIFINF